MTPPPPERPAPAAGPDDLPAGWARDTRRRERRANRIVGAFVAFALALGGLFVWSLGQKQHVFEQRAVLHAAFADVQGLRPGAPIWLAGVAVGTVARMRFAPRESEAAREGALVLCDLEITRDALDRVGADSLARIGSQGLLGDRIVEITIASADAARLRPGDALRTASPPDLNQVVEQAAAAVAKVQQAATSAAGALQDLATPEAVADTRAAMASLRRLLGAAERGPGLVHALLYDRRQVAHLEALLGSLEETATGVERGVRSLDRVLAPLGDQAAPLTRDLARAARGLADAGDELRASGAVRNLGRAAADAAALADYARAGRGTLGALLVDPTVYERLVGILGGAARSRLLRALVRYAISRDQPGGQPPAPAPPAAPSPAAPPPPRRSP